MPATEIIRWLLSTGRTYPTVPKLQAALAAQADAVAAGVWKTEARFPGRGENGDIRRAVQDMTAVDPHAEGHQRGTAQPAPPTNRATMLS